MTLAEMKEKTGKAFSLGFLVYFVYNLIFCLVSVCTNNIFVPVNAFLIIIICITFSMAYSIIALFYCTGPFLTVNAIALALILIIELVALYYHVKAKRYEEKQENCLLSFLSYSVNRKTFIDYFDSVKSLKQLEEAYTTSKNFLLYYKGFPETHNYSAREKATIESARYFVDTYEDVKKCTEKLIAEFHNSLVRDYSSYASNNHLDVTQFETFDELLVSKMYQSYKQ